MIAAALLLAGGVILLASVWLINLPAEAAGPPVPLELPPTGSHVAGGTDEQSLRIELLENPSDDPSVSDDQQKILLEERLLRNQCHRRSDFTLTPR